jgi:hypothetical protein
MRQSPSEGRSSKPATRFSLAGSHLGNSGGQPAGNLSLAGIPKLLSLKWTDHRPLLD